MISIWGSTARRRVALYVAALCLASPPLVAQTLGSVIDASQSRIRLAQASQERIDKIVDDTRGLEAQYKSITKEVDGLEVYNRLLETQTTNQSRELERITSSIDRVSVIERQIMPLMLRMIDGLDQFVSLDVPFLEEERSKRVTGVRALMERSDITVAEKFRKVLEAFQIENDYGRTIEDYRTMQTIAGAPREADFLRIGRIGLFYMTPDSRYLGTWDNESRAWVELPSKYVTAIRQGLRMARDQVAPDLLLLPLAAPEEGDAAPAPAMRNAGVSGSAGGSR